MLDFAEMTGEVMHLIEEHPHHHGDSLSTSMRGEMAVMRMLGTCHESGMYSAGGISSRLGMTTSRIAAVLNNLEKKRLIVRMEDPKDKRRVLVALTEEGRAFCRSREAFIRQDITRMLTALGEEDAAAFIRLLNRIFQITSSPEYKKAREESFAEIRKEAFHET